jgi:hypothetical protein
MNEKKIVVPDGMLKAADSVQNSTMNSERVVTTLETALRWLSEHPVVPNDNESRTLLHFLRHRAHYETTANDISLTQRVINEWQRRCFLAPEPDGKPLRVTFPHAGKFIVEVFDDKPPCMRAKAEEITDDPKAKNFFNALDTALAGPAPESPEEIKDLLLPDIESGFFKPEVVNERLAEAFHRGQKSKDPQ